MPPVYRQGTPNRYGAYTQDQPIRVVNPADVRTAGVSMGPGDWFEQNAPAAPAQPAAETPQQELARFEADYHAPDREAVLAKMRAQMAGPGAASPAGGGTWDQARFAREFGSPGTPQELIALEDRLRQAGISVERNAAGVAGKIKLPNGQYVDVIRSAGTGGGAGNFQWLTGDGGGGGGALGPMPNPQGFRPGELENTGLTAPYTPQPYTGGTFQAPMFNETFQAPTMQEVQNEPGFQFRLGQGQQALERSAAAKGSVLSGGTQKSLNRYAQDYASGEFQNVYNRRMGEHQNRFGQFLGNAGLQQQGYQNRYGEFADQQSRALQAHLANQANRVGAIGRWWDVNQRNQDRGLSAAGTR